MGVANLLPVPVQDEPGGVLTTISLPAKREMHNQVRASDGDGKSPRREAIQSKERAMSTAIPTNAVALKEKSDQLLVSVRAFKVTNKETAEEAGRMVKSLSELDGEVDNTFLPVIADANSLHKKLIAQYKIHSEPIKNGIAHLKLEGRNFFLADQRREREERDRQDRERQETERKQQEEQAKIELEQRKAEEARLKAQQEADRLLNEAAEKERQAELANGEEQSRLKAESDALLSKAVEATPAPVKELDHRQCCERDHNFDGNCDVHPPPPLALKLVPPAPAIKSVPGLGSRKVWKWRVSDKALIPREYLTINEIILNALAKTAKSHPEVIPGIEFYEDLEMRRS